MTNPTNEELIALCDSVDSFRSHYPFDNNPLLRDAFALSQHVRSLLTSREDKPVGWLYKNGYMTGFRIGASRPDERASWSPLYAQPPSPPAVERGDADTDRRRKELADALLNAAWLQPREDAKAALAAISQVLLINNIPPPPSPRVADEDKTLRLLKKRRDNLVQEYSYMESDTGATVFTRDDIEDVVLELDDLIEEAEKKVATPPQDLEKRG